MCRLRMPNGILNHWQMAGLASLADTPWRRLFACHDARQPADPRDRGGEGAEPARGDPGSRPRDARLGRRQYPQRHRLAHRRHRSAGTARYASLCAPLAFSRAQHAHAHRPAAQVQRRLRRRRRGRGAGGHQRYRLSGRRGGRWRRGRARHLVPPGPWAASPATRISRATPGVYLKPEDATAVADAIVRVYHRPRRPHRPHQGAAEVSARCLGLREIPHGGRGEARPAADPHPRGLRQAAAAARPAGPYRRPPAEAGRARTGSASCCRAAR